MLNTDIETGCAYLITINTVWRYKWDNQRPISPKEKDKHYTEN
jgi:hypothetical protein